MIEQLKNLTAEVALLEERIKKLRAAIEALQAVCYHDYKEAGHDSHYRYFECAICGKTEKA